MGIAGNDGGHDRGVGNAQPLQASQSQPLIDHSLVILPHPGGANGVENRRGNVAGCPCKLFIGADLRAWLQLTGFEFGHSPRRHQLAGMADTVRSNPSVIRRGKVVGLDRRRFVEIGRTDVAGAPAFRPQIAHRNGDRGVGVQWLAKCVQRERLYVVLDIGSFVFTAGPGKDAKLARSHRHRAGAVEQILRGNRRLADQPGGPFIKCPRAAYAKNGPDLQMVL